MKIRAEGAPDLPLPRGERAGVRGGAWFGDVSFSSSAGGVSPCALVGKSRVEVRQIRSHAGMYRTWAPSRQAAFNENVRQSAETRSPGSEGKTQPRRHWAPSLRPGVVGRHSGRGSRTDHMNWHCPLAARAPGETPGSCRCGDVFSRGFIRPIPSRASTIRGVNRPMPACGTWAASWHARHG